MWKPANPGLVFVCVANQNDFVFGNYKFDVNRAVVIIVVIIWLAYPNARLEFVGEKARTILFQLAEYSSAGFQMVKYVGTGGRRQSRFI